MFKHKVIDLLKSLSTDELKKLGDFISSPYFIKSKNVILAYNYIIQFYPSFKNENLSRFKMYEHLYNSNNYKDSSLRNVLARFVKAIEMFLAYEKLQRDQLSQDNLLLEELIRRNLPHIFMKNLKTTENRLRKTKVDFDYLLNRYRLERNKFNFSTQNDKIISKSKVYPRIKKLSDSGIYLTIYFITEIINENINIIVYNEKFNAEEKLSNTISIILDCVDYVRIYSAIKGENECDFMLEIYMHLLSAFRNLEDDNTYYSYKELINKYKTCLSRDEISFHYSIMLGCCILKGKLMRYPQKYNMELIELYGDILKYEYYINKKVKYLPHDLYRDILFLKIRVNRLDLVKILIDKYTEKIEPAERTNMYNFSSAFYYYELKEYNRSLKYINKIRMDYFIYKYDVKNLLLKVYFELGYYEEALSLIHSYRELLRKDTFLTDSRKIINKNFIRFLRKLILLKIDHNKRDFEDLKQELNTTERITYKHWLLEKIDESVLKGQ